MGGNMSKRLTPNELRSLSESGKLSENKKEEDIKTKRQQKQHYADLKEAQDRIKEAEDTMRRAASRGKKEVSACVLRRGIHFEERFDTKHSPEFLGTIGRTVYDHFVLKGFKVGFRNWEDAMHYDFESDYGYEVIVTW